MTLKEIAQDVLDEDAWAAFVATEDYGTSEGVRLSWLHRQRRLPKKVLCKLEFPLVPVSHHNFGSSSNALLWARNNGVARVLSDSETGGKGEINISNNSLAEMLNPVQRQKSASVGIHLDAVTVLHDLIKESHIVETHPDYLKGPDGKRSAANGKNPGIMIDVAYAAMRQKVGTEEKNYRVKITLKRFDDQNLKKKAYAYHVEEIEVLPVTSVKPDDSGPHHQGRTSLPANMLLKNVSDVNGVSLIS